MDNMREGVTFQLFVRKILALAAPAQAEKPQFMPGHLKLESLFNKPFDLFHLAIFKILRFAATPADQMVMVFTIIIRKLITSPLRDVVYFRQHPELAEELNGTINRG
jgi:hypothetical protein